MADRNMSDYISNVRGASPAALNHLRQLVDRYPYFHAARIAYLRNLYKNHDPNFGQELRKAALYLPSREVLYAMIEGERLNPAQFAKSQGVRPKKSGSEDSSTRTESLIGQFLDTVDDPKPRRAQKTDASVDYLEFLRQNEMNSEVFGTADSKGHKTKQQEKGNDVINKFLENEGKFQIHERKDEELLHPQEKFENEADSGVLTEMMAKIYIKQGKYDKAFEIIKRLSLKNPKKNRYFADQIRFLQKIIINNNNK